ncbi:hypothetical protein ACLK2I_01115 [Escherichia coli]
MISLLVLTDGKHYFGINWDRDVANPEIADIRNVVAGDQARMVRVRC